MIDLTERLPTLSPQELLAGFVPGARFQAVSFENYLPNPEFPSQAGVRDELAAFAARASRPAGKLRLFRKTEPGEGLYLDGGFGVGKTHLLAATWFAFQPPASPGRGGGGGQKAFLSFQELLYAVGALGMEEAIRAFAPYRLLTIDEFELDDPGNTHMVNTFLGQLVPNGTRVVTTSNTEPGALGEGRFNARDFERQIAAIANRFRVLRLGGPDYRARGQAPTSPLSEAEYAAWRASQEEATFAEVEHRALNRHLLEVHPARFGKLLSGVSAVGVQGLAPMPDQGVGLRFVHFIDKVYDLGIHFGATGAPLGNLFPDTYRHGAYAKKYSRCLSRLGELLAEARETTPAERAPHP